MQAAVVVAAFNLVCNVQAFGDDVLPAASERVIIYRVDPMLGRFCWDARVSTQPIAALSAGEVVFAMDGGDFAGAYRTVIRVQLLSGAYSQTDIRFAQPQLVMTGQCERARFSGFPPASPRFATPLRVEVPSSID